MKKERNQRKKKNVISGNQPKVNQQCQKMKNPVKNEDANVFGMHIYSDDINANETIDLNEVSKKTKILGLDCEMVGAGSKGQRSILARVSIVDQFGQVLYDKFVTTKHKVSSNLKSPIFWILPRGIYSSKVRILFPTPRQKVQIFFPTFFF